MLGIRERAQTLGGQARIYSPAEGGTVVEISIPLARFTGRGGGGMIRVLLADDHAMVRAGLQEMLADTGDMTVTGEAGNGQEVLASVREHDYDVVVLDMSMPGSSGIELIRQVRTEKPKLRILVLSMHGEAQYAVRAIRAGASGYLTKDCRQRPARGRDPPHRRGRRLREPGDRRKARARFQPARGGRGAAHPALRPGIPGFPDDRRRQQR